MIMMMIMTIDMRPAAKTPERIARALRARIMEGAMAPDDALPGEKELMAEFGASRGSVREALKSLEFQGMICSVPGPRGGVRVRAIEEERVFEYMRSFFHFQALDAEQIYAVRKLVEPALAESVVGHLSESQFARLQASIAVLDDHDIHAWASQRAAEIEFHEILAEACPNPLLAMMARFVNEVIRSAVAGTAPSPAHAPDERAFVHANCAAHAAIVVALRNGDRASVKRLMLAHIEAAEQFIVPLHARTLARRPLPKSS